MVSRVSCTTLIGVEAFRVDVETQVISAAKRFSIVGLPDGVLREAKDRVRCAIEHSGFNFPNGEVIVSLAPAALPKFGSGFDLAIAVSILAAVGQINQKSVERHLFIGELALDGNLKAVPGEISSAAYAKRHGRMSMVVSKERAEQLALFDGLSIYGFENLIEVVLFLNSIKNVEPVVVDRESFFAKRIDDVSFGDVIGQHAAKRALEISAAGGHNLLMVGPPGAGKTMLAKRVLSLYPELTCDEALEVTKIHAACAAINAGGSGCTGALVTSRPFRSPHHTTSTAGLIGGGSSPVPGEISLAHRGVLFLDEFVELKRDVIESLREPLEQRAIVVSRAKMRVRFPADFVLLAAMNPCPCGKRGLNASESRAQKSEGQRTICDCPPQAVKRYFGKLSGPILDRLDLQLWIPPVPALELGGERGEDPTPRMRERVLKARDVQARRYRVKSKLNSHLSSSEVADYCMLDEGGRKIIERATEQFGLSARGYMRVLKVARTIADLEESQNVTGSHLAEALSYRMRF